MNNWNQGAAYLNHSIKNEELNIEHSVEDMEYISQLYQKEKGFLR
jgi:hypothetical protein